MEKFASKIVGQIQFRFNPERTYAGMIQEGKYLRKPFVGARFLCPFCKRSNPFECVDPMGVFLSCGSGECLLYNADFREKNGKVQHRGWYNRPNFEQKQAKDESNPFI